MFEPARDPEPPKPLSWHLRAFLYGAFIFGAIIAGLFGIVLAGLGVAVMAEAYPYISLIVFIAGFFIIVAYIIGYENMRKKEWYE